MQHFSVGIQHFFSGCKLIFQPGLRRFVIIPLIINVLLFAALFLSLRHFAHLFDQWFTHYLPAWLHWLSSVIWLLFFISFFLLYLYLFVTFANIISAPFNSFLAEKVEFYLTGHLPLQRSLWQNIQDVPRILGRQFTILGYYIPRAFLLLILFFIPIIHFIAPILWFLFNAWFMTLTYIDYPTDNHRIPIREVRKLLKQKRAMGLGFGISVLVASMIPILNFFAIPAAVAGATQFWVKECM